MSQSILLVEDDNELSDLLSRYLSGEGMSVKQIFDGQEAFDHIRRAHDTSSLTYDAVILDFMLPNMQGLDILQRVRAFSTIPILMLTARGDDIDRIVGLESGADDYLAKPCNPRELLARLRAILRRTESAQSAPSNESKIVAAHGIVLDASRRLSNINNQTLDLTSAEFNTLLALISKPGEVISKEALTELALNRKFTRYDRSIDVHISSIRKKIGEHLVDKDIIKTVRGSGYILISEADD